MRSLLVLVIVEVLSYLLLCIRIVSRREERRKKGRGRKRRRGEKEFIGAENEPLGNPEITFI